MNKNVFVIGMFEVSCMLVLAMLAFELFVQIITGCKFVDIIARIDMSTSLVCGWGTKLNTAGILILLSTLALCVLSGEEEKHITVQETNLVAKVITPLIISVAILTGASIFLDNVFPLVSLATIIIYGYIVMYFIWFIIQVRKY